MQACKLGEPRCLRSAKRNSRTAKSAALSVAFAALLAASTPAGAVDGCLVMLCLAAPSWRAIPQCVPPIRQLLRDLARGKLFPTCNMAGGGNTASHAWAAAPDDCPPQYTRLIETESKPIHTCDYVGSVTVSFHGSVFSRTWWMFDGDTVTEFSPAAKAQLGHWDTRFDDEYIAWRAALPPPSPPVETDN